MTEEANCYECDTPLTTICPQCNPYLSAAPSPDGEEDEVERVARRICRETHEPITQEKHAVMALDLTLNMDRYRRLARAAISAMRPTSPEPPE